jgi:hypothetical protein
MAAAHELVLLEERAADVAVEKVLEVGVEVLHAVLEVGRGLRVGDGADEEVDEPIERVLVHRVDVGEEGDAEEEERGAVRHGLVAVARLVDLDLGLVGDLLLLADLVREHLGGREDVDRRRVLEDRAALAAREHLEDLILDFFELLLVGGRLLHEPPLLLLEVGPFLGDDDAEQLVLQARGRDHKVEQRHLDLQLGLLERKIELGTLAEQRQRVLRSRVVSRAATARAKVASR